MKQREYIFDRVNFRFRKVTRSIWRPLRLVLRVLLVSLSLFIVFYVLVSLVVDTDTEKRLRRENRMYEKAYPQLRPSEQLLGGALSALQGKDNSIYEEVFHASSPGVDPIASLDFLFGSDTIPDTRIVTYTMQKADRLLVTAEQVDSAFAHIFASLAAPNFVLPPMEMPLRDISYPQVGASVGPRLNPFYKAEVPHNGIDLIAPRGAPVFAPAAGTVTEVENRRTGEGKSVSISHPGGYVTRYTHLSEIVVSKGQNVAKGKRIGDVGMSGSAFAPHLHYEVLKDGEVQDPVGYFFASVSAADYPNMLFMAAHTRQSMD